MIRKYELARIAELKLLSLVNAEKDYLLELLLFFLSENKRYLVFKGGTAMYKFHSLNRFSEDLDFDSVGKGIRADRLIKNIVRKLTLLGMKGTITESEEYVNETNIRFMIRGPLYDGRKNSMTRLTINISKRERPESSSLKMLIPSYQEIPSFDLSVLDPDEIAAEKIRCILTREKPRDIYDLWFLSMKGIIPVTDMINRKLSLYDMAFDPDSVLSRIGERKGMWERDLSGLVIGSLPPFDRVFRDLKGIISSIE